MNLQMAFEISDCDIEVALKSRFTKSEIDILKPLLNRDSASRAALNANTIDLDSQTIEAYKDLEDQAMKLSSKVF